ncbi:MAG: hypothetical protein ACJ76H_03475 [Bacteriovoracaceae bacterium]
MKVLFAICFLSLFTNAFAQANRNVPGNPQTDKPSVKTTNPPAVPEKQKQEEATSPDLDPFHPGPYKDGEYQFWGKDEQLDRDKREEQNQ